MKTFLLRELAFLLAPVLLVTQFKELASRVVWLLAATIFALILVFTLAAFVLQPVGWGWLGVVVGFAAAALAGIFVFGLGL